MGIANHYPFCYRARDYPHLKGKRWGIGPYKRDNGGDRGLAPSRRVGHPYLKFRLHGIMWFEDYRLEDPKMHEQPVPKWRLKKYRRSR